MFEMMRHKVRQLGYRWLTLSDEPLYLLFEKMYRYDPQRLPDVTPHPGERGFLLTNFLCPEFSRYRGREITFFNARHVAVYWMPGALHSGGGYVEPGHYKLTVGRYALKRPLELSIAKDDDKTVIHAATLQMRPVKLAAGGFISFKVIAKELQCQVQSWLAQLHAQIDTVRDSQQLRDVIDAVLALPDHADLQAQAALLQRRLAARA